MCSSSFIPADAGGGSEVLDSWNVLLKTALRRIGKWKKTFLVPKQGVTAIRLRNTATITRVIRRMDATWMQTKNTRDNSSTKRETMRFVNQRRWLMSASHRLIYDNSLLSGDAISEPVKPDWAGRLGRRETREKNEALSKSVVFPISKCTQWVSTPLLLS